nr:hypothetical protein [Lasius neglectus picorna-like virus 8]
MSQQQQPTRPFCPVLGHAKRLRYDAKTSPVGFLMGFYEKQIITARAEKVLANQALNTLPVDERPDFVMQGLNTIIANAKDQRRKLNEFHVKTTGRGLASFADYPIDDSEEESPEAPKEYVFRVKPPMQAFVFAEVGRLLTPYVPTVKAEKKMMRDWLWQVIRHYCLQVSQVDANLANAIVETLAFAPYKYGSSTQPRFETMKFLGRTVDEWTYDQQNACDRKDFIHTMIYAYSKKVGSI